MKTIFGVLSLLVVLAIVGAVAVADLHQIEIAAGGSGAVISATTTGATSQQQSQTIQQNLEHSVEAAHPQVEPVAEVK